MNDYFSAGYIGCPSFLFDALARLLNVKFALVVSDWWSWAMVACILYGFWSVYAGMVEKTRVLGGGVNKWSAEAGKWKFTILKGACFIHANYILLGIIKIAYSYFYQPAVSAF